MSKDKTIGFNLIFLVPQNMINIKYNNRIEGRNIVSDIHNLPFLN